MIKRYDVNARDYGYLKICLDEDVAKLEAENEKMSERINIINFESEEVRYKLEAENERLRKALEHYAKYSITGGFIAQKALEE